VFDYVTGSLSLCLCVVHWPQCRPSHHVTHIRFVKIIGRALDSKGWPKIAIRQIANGRNADLRDLYLYDLEVFHSYYFVYIDEFGCDKYNGFRRTGWSPLRVTPTQVAQFQHEKQYQIIASIYTRWGYVCPCLSRSHGWCRVRGLD
jgi:hypothetical protein